MLKFTLRKISRTENITIWCVTEGFPLYWWEQCLSVVFKRGTRGMLWAANASRTLQQRTGMCLYRVTWPWNWQQSSFSHHEGNCDRHLHKVSLQSRSRMKFNQTLTFLIIKTKWSFFIPSLLALDKATNWWNLSCLHAESFLSKSSRFCYWADDKKKTNHQTKTTNH